MTTPHGESAPGPTIRLGDDSGLLTTDESIELVKRMLGGAIRPTAYHLADDTIVCALTVDPDIAFEAIRTKENARG